MKPKVAVVLLIVLAGAVGAIYLTSHRFPEWWLHPVEEPLHTSTAVQGGPTAIATPSPDTETIPELPETTYVNGVEMGLYYYYDTYSSQDIDISDAAKITILYSPIKNYLEFVVKIKNATKLYETAKSVWNETGLIYSERVYTGGLYRVFWIPVPLNDAHGRLFEIFVRMYRAWTGADYEMLHMTTVRELLDTKGEVVKTKLWYVESVTSEKFYAMTSFETVSVGAWRVKVGDTEERVMVGIKFEIPEPLLAHSPNKEEYILSAQLVWYRDPYFYEVAVPAFKFVADFLNLDYVGRAQLIRNFFSSLGVSGVNAANFGEVLARGGSCREYAFYSMMLAKELGVRGVYMLLAMPRASPENWIILTQAPIGHAVAVTDDPSIGDSEYSITFGGKTFYVFVDNGWALANWEEFLSMVRDGVAYLAQPNPQYNGLSPGDIHLTLFLLGILRDYFPFNTVVNGSLVIVVYSEYADSTPISDHPPVLEPTNERFNLSIPLYNVSMYVTDLFRYDMRSVLSIGGVLEVENTTNYYGFFVKRYESCFDVIRVCVEGRCEEVLIPKPDCRVGYYGKYLYPNGVYEVVEVYSSYRYPTAHRVAFYLPLIIQNVKDIEAEKTSATASIGEPVEVGGYRVTVLEVKEVRYVKSIIGPYHQVPNGTKGVLVTLIIEVTGQKVWCPERYTAWGYLITESGKKYRFTTSGELPLIEEYIENIEEKAVRFLDLTMSACRGPGESTGGHLLFAVPEGEKPAKLVLYIGSAEIVVDLT